MKLLLAPIQGMTIAHYRTIYEDIFGGIDTFYAPFISTTDPFKASPSLFKDLLPEINRHHNVVPQLLSNNATDFIHFSKTLVNIGYKEINWNLGCPYPMVTKKKKGSGLLPYPLMVQSFLDEVCHQLSYDLTVKIRLGLNTLEEGIEIIKCMNQYPINKVIIHPRIGIQKYTGTVDLDGFHQLNTLCEHPVIYNGDIFTRADYFRIQALNPSIDTFMLGRGALRDPFLPSTIRGITFTPDEKIHKLKTFHHSIYDYYKTILSGDRHLLDRMKEFWSYTSYPYDPSGKFMKKLKKCRSTHEYLSIVAHFFNAIDKAFL